ncbi:alpha/beta-Hydrolases superfamily protein [Striga hermonthica]|uniref:Alpha/beta-Hydrolases superfamily protein n=1 Tax=Striga hermonthica TaxID=68872 RepID=A0A9N7N979_STRHE|nr:alpha/beta-Hydrolases superfamily protein [Striga hermonthica]
MAHPIHEANSNSPYGHLTRAEFYRKHNILHDESFMTDDQNLKIFTQSWQPSSTYSGPLKGLIAMIHGYTSESGWLFELTAVAMAKSGFFVSSLDLPGHGLSEGPPEHITDLDPLIRACIKCFDSARARHPGIPHFLYGESLGGALAVLVAVEQKAMWRGLVLAGAMCEVSGKFKPPWPLERLLPAVAAVAPAWRISVTEPPARRSYREGWKRELAEGSPNRRSCGRATAATGVQLLRACERVRRECSRLETALLVVHGGDDVICDPEGARRVYGEAGSEDKMLRVYEDMWHMWIGEPNDRVDEVFGEIMTWIEDRADFGNNEN